MNAAQQDPHAAQHEDNHEDEISLKDMVDFLAGAWRKLAIASVIGAVVGFGFWVLFFPYTGEYVLINSGYVDILSWKSLQKTLPNLALQISEKSKLDKTEEDFFKSVSTELWWSKNVIANYALSKADAKDLAGLSKDLDAAPTTIVSLSINSSGKTKDEAVDHTLRTAQFMRTGSSYLQIRSLINNYEISALTGASDLNAKITSAKIELGYQLERLKQLELLNKRFPGSSNASNGQIFDPKESGAKYLPLQTQIIAANSEINNLKENLIRLQRQLAQVGETKRFVEKARPLIDQSFDGLWLTKQLLDLEANQRKEITSDNEILTEILDKVHATLSQYSARFNKGWESTTIPTASKTGMAKFTAAGLVGAFFLMLMALLAQRVWMRINLQKTE